MKTIQLLIAILLFPLSIWYAVGVAVRNWLYDVGIKKTSRSPIPTIGIGNLRMGGTG
jgi:tetraacyldisaccharide 4'-kinase